MRYLARFVANCAFWFVLLWVIRFGTQLHSFLAQDLIWGAVLIAAATIGIALHASDGAQ